MCAEFPLPGQKPQLRWLFQACFQDDDNFLDLFFTKIYDPHRCRCMVKEGIVTAALYWFDCIWNGKKCAYLYAVGTDPDFRNQGLCRALLEDTHRLLKDLGYAGTVLVPDGAGLHRMYARLGYRALNCVNTVSCRASEEAAWIQECTPEEYALARKQLLPSGGILQEGKGLELLSFMYRLYRGKDFLLAAWKKGAHFEGTELLGNVAAAPGILAALDVRQGTFRVPGNGMFAMYFPLEESFAPQYFGLAFD